MKPSKKPLLSTLSPGSGADPAHHSPLTAHLSFTPLLTSLGLNGDEAVVYETLLSEGALTARELSTRTPLSRTLLYHILDRLVEKKMVIKDEEAQKVALFSAESPQTLTARAEAQKRASEEAYLALQNSLGSLQNMYNLATGKPGVQFYEGADGVRKVLDDTLTAKGAVYTYTDLEMIEKYIPEINREHVAKRERLGIKKFALLPDTQENRFLLEGYHVKITDVKLIPADTAGFATAMQIYDGRVSYSTFSDTQMVGVIITDKAIYEMHKAVFEALYNSPTAKAL